LKNSTLSVKDKTIKLLKLLSENEFFEEMDYFLHFLKENYFFAPKYLNHFKEIAYLYFHPEEIDREELLFKQFREGAHSLEDILKIPLKSNLRDSG
jgi:hypothetical protein